MSNITCPICGESCDMIGYDYDNSKASYSVHYTKRAEDPRDTIALCQWVPKRKDKKRGYFTGKWTTDFYTPHEALQIGCWLLRAVIDLEPIIRKDLQS